MAWSNWENVEVRIGGARKAIQGTPAVAAWGKGKFKSLNTKDPCSKRLWG